MRLADRVACARTKLDEYTSVCIMLSREHRSAFASAIVLAYDEVLATHPGQKPTLDEIKVKLREAPELRGFVIPPIVITAFFGWIIQMILDWLWSNR